MFCKHRSSGTQELGVLASFSKCSGVFLIRDCSACNVQDSRDSAQSSATPGLNIIICLVIFPLRLAIDFPLIITSGWFIINKTNLSKLSLISWLKWKQMKKNKFLSLLYSYQICLCSSLVIPEPEQNIHNCLLWNISVPICTNKNLKPSLLWLMFFVGPSPHCREVCFNEFL